jgi:lipopolysaccharide export system ATP-binding protein
LILFNVLRTTCLFSKAIVGLVFAIAPNPYLCQDSTVMILRAENLVKKYKKRTVVNDVSVQVKQGEIVGLLGPNGAGKTTTFYMTVGLIKPNEGRIFLDSEEITALPMYQRAKLGIGYLAQEASVFRKLTVEENILAVLEMRDFTREQRKQRVEEMLEEFSLTRVRKNLGMSLSGGERRRTEIARALAVDPKFVLLDEPFAGVDPIAVEEIQGIVARLKTKNIGILITDHNVDETLSITDRAYLMVDGKLFKSGTAQELASDPQVRKVYLGQNFELRRAKVVQTTDEWKDEAGAM